MQRQVGDLALDSRGLARRGLLIRHLVMPHNIGGTDRFVRWVAQALGPKTAVNLGPVSTVLPGEQISQAGAPSDTSGVAAGRNMGKAGWAHAADNVSRGWSLR
jgi:hypothetical protein